jgi:hypothetical protein
MTLFNFDDVIGIYNSSRADVKEYKVTGKASKEIDAIKVDIARSFGFLRSKDDVALWKRRVLRKIQYDILSTIPVEYIQSMSEIVSVIIHYYFNSELDRIGPLHKSRPRTSQSPPEDEVLVQDSGIVGQGPMNNAEEMSSSCCSDELEETYDNIDKNLPNIARITITNVLREKYEPLVSDDFRLYLHYNRVFLKMMEKRKKIIHLDESLRFMNTTLTWFTRSLTNMKDIYAIFGMTLSCPTTFPFLLLVKFYDQISAKEEIRGLEPNLYEQLIELEKEFLITEDELSRPGAKILGRSTIIFAGSALIILGAILYRLNKRDD